MKSHDEKLSARSFWAKLRRSAQVAGRAVLEPALTLYYAFNDPDTPMRAKAVITGALVYFISPLDAIPDVVPVIGYSDDLAMLIGAVAIVAAHIKAEHKERAARQTALLLG